MKNKTIFILILLCCLSSVAKADIFHYKNVLVGDRGANMGGAYIALSDDSSGCYYNPAGVSYTVGANLSGSVNAYHLQKSVYKSAIRGYDWKRDSAELLPNFFGLIKNYGKHSFGVSVVVPDSFVQHQDQSIDNLPDMGGRSIARYTLSRHEEDATTMSGVTYAYEISETLAVGTTLNYYYRKNRIENNQTILYADGLYRGDFYNTSWFETGLSPKLGVRWAPHKKFAVGATLSQVFIVQSKWKNMGNTKEEGSADLIFIQDDTKARRNTPLEFGLGLAMFPTEDITFTFDTNYYTNSGRDVFALYGYESVINFSFAGEYKINKKNVVRLGYFTNNSNVPVPNTNTRGLEHINMWGIATGYSIHNEVTSFTIGLVYSQGGGLAQIYGDSNPSLVSVKRYSATGLFSTNYKI